MPVMVFELTPPIMPPTPFAFASFKVFVGDFAVTFP